MANEKPQAGAEKSAKVEAIYGKPSIALADSDQVYTGRAGDKSIKLATATVHVLSCGLRITANVYARLDSQMSGITVSPSVPRDCKFADTDQRDHFLDAIVREVERWNGYGAAMQSAMAALTGVKQPKANDAKTPQTKLVVSLATLRAVNGAAVATVPAVATGNPA